MTITRVSTYANFQKTISDFNGVQARMAELQGQISSGYKSSDYKGLNGQVELFSSLESKISKSKSYLENNAIIESRMQTTNKAMDDVISTADNMKTLIVNRRSATGDSLNFEQQMKSLMSQLAGALNSNVEGRFLFAGTATDQKPVVDPVTAPLELGTPDSGYYRGSAQDLTARVDDYIDIKYNVRADNPAFQKLFAAADLALKASTASNDAQLASAFSLMEQGFKESVGVQSSVNANIVALGQVNNRHESMQTYWKGFSEQISKTDILSASTQVAVDQSVLSATFQSFSRLNQLRLSDFLR